MKKLTLCMAVAFMLLPFVQSPITARTATTMPPDSTKTVEWAVSNALMLRLDEINAMDKSDLSAKEKRQLRKEVRAIKSRASDLGGGVYISVGALLIVIILLILLL